MAITHSSDSTTSVAADVLIVLMTDQHPFSGGIQHLDEALQGRITAAVERDDFDPQPKQLLTFFQAGGVAATNVVLTGVGNIGECDLRVMRQSLLAALRTCCQHADQKVAIAFDEAIIEKFSDATLAELAADSITSSPIDADLYRKERTRHAFAEGVLCLSGDAEALNTAITRGVITGEACGLVKDLVNCPASDLYPETFADKATAAAQGLNLELQILDEDDLQTERMGAMLAVAKGSVRPPRLVKIAYRGAASDQPMLGLVGKGVTFDSGGYSIKPSDGMIAMKSDMAGAATVLATVVAAARLQLPINVTGYLGLVENMISGNAYRLGDVLIARNGTTIEVHNTDAEGRLVLADVLSYAVDDGCTRLVDLATLTGACVVALGEEITGVFPGDRQLGDVLCAASEAVGELFWPMPMHEHFVPLLKSNVADCKNVGPRWGGAVTAAKFLQKFVGETPWVHLDIAGPSWADSGNAWQDAGATAVPVRSLIQFLEQ